MSANDYLSTKFTTTFTPDKPFITDPDWKIFKIADNSKTLMPNPFGESYNETLEITPEAISTDDFTGLATNAFKMGFNDIIGTVRAIWIEGNDLMAAIAPVKDKGYLLESKMIEARIGYKVMKYELVETVNGVNTMKAVDWKISIIGLISKKIKG